MPDPVFENPKHPFAGQAVGNVASKATHVAAYTCYFDRFLQKPFA